MKFNLVYGNHAHNGVHISDTLRLIKYSLESIGHLVSVAPMMVQGQTNILIENFTYDFIEVMKQLRDIPNTRFILLATEYISDKERFNYFPWEQDIDQSHYAQDPLWTKRWKTFCLATELSDAIWHLSESQIGAYQQRFPRIPVGYLPHAYLQELNRVPPRSKDQKDIDVLFTGTITPYRGAILNRLQSAGMSVAIGKINAPDHVREDWVGRSKLAINLKQNPNWPYPSNSRFFYHIVNHSLLVTEKCPSPCDLDPYVIHAAEDEFVGVIKNLLEQDTAALAALQLASIKKQRPMQPLITELLENTFTISKTES